MFSHQSHYPTKSNTQHIKWNNLQEFHSYMHGYELVCRQITYRTSHIFSEWVWYYKLLQYRLWLCVGPVTPGIQERMLQADFKIWSSTQTHTYIWCHILKGFGGRPCNCSTLGITIVGRFQGHTQFGKLKLLVWVVVGENQIGIGFDFWSQF